MSKFWIAVVAAIAVSTLLPFPGRQGIVHAEAQPGLAWAREWNSSGLNEDIGLLAAVDAQNVLYTAGRVYRQGSANDLDYLLMQYDAAGNLVWERRYGGTDWEQASGLIVPSPGEVVVTGFSTTPAGTDVATVKYDRAGNLLWERRLPSPGILADIPPRIDADAEGNILICSTRLTDYLVLKYAPDGTLVWSRTHDGPEAGFDLATDIAAGPDGSVYVTGTVNDSHAFSTVKYSPAGDFQWEQIEPGDIGSVFSPAHVKVGPDGNPVIAGSPESTCGVFQFRIWKCAASNGSVLWWDKRPVQPCLSLVFADLALDADGNAFAVCTGSDTGANNNIVTLKYTAAGTREWVREFDGANGIEDVATAITTDRHGSAFVTGASAFGVQDRDYATVKYSAGGAQEWSVVWGSPNHTNDIPRDLAVDPAGGVIVVGHTYNPTQNENVVTVKYQQVAAADTPEGVAAMGAPALEVHPNPARADAVVRYSLPVAGNVRIDAFAPDGRFVRTIASGMHAAGEHAVPLAGGSGLPVGTYLLRMKSGAGSGTTKVNVLR